MSVDNKTYRCWSESLHGTTIQMPCHSIFYDEGLFASFLFLTLLSVTMQTVQRVPDMMVTSLVAVVAVVQGKSLKITSVFLKEEEISKMV